jgi:hypothetical protein
MNWYGEGNPFTYLWIDTYRTRLRVTGITLVEDPAHPESWLRDATFEYWDAAKERWVGVQPLLSDAAVHTHKFARPVESARFRIVLPKQLCGNLRLGEVVLHGEKLGPSHPDVIAKRPVAVLFDEGDDLKGYLPRAKFALGGAYSGNRSLTVHGEPAYSCAPHPEGAKVFGTTLPNWEFEIVERPKAGQYRYLQFAWRVLAPGTKGIGLQVDDGGADGVMIHAGAFPPGGATRARKVADEPPREWRVVRVDLWEVFRKPVRVRGLRLDSVGGPAAFDQVLLAQSEKDLPPPRKAARPAEEGPAERLRAAKERTEEGWARELGIVPVVLKKDRKTGFVVGGKNATALIQSLEEINGITIADLERSMRPGALSIAGFLGKDEKLLEVLAADNHSCEWHRGLLDLRVERGGFRARALARFADEDGHWVERLTVEAAPSSCATVARCPLLARPVSLEVRGSLRADDLEKVLSSPHLAGLRRLALLLYGEGVAVTALERCPQLGRLTHLYLHSNRIGADGARRLRKVVIEDEGVSEATMKALRERFGCSGKLFGD